jgi:pimeloyl-ACP methyl ester carboxylesterase
MAGDVDESMVDVAGITTFVRRSGGGDQPPTILVHGNPDSSRSWQPLLARAAELGPVIAPDLPGFGRSERPPRERFDCKLPTYEWWFRRFLDTLEIDSYRLVVHDWGSLALASASRHPEQVKRLVVMDAVPLHGDYRWHWIARLLWRPPVIGELSMPMLGRFALTHLSRLSSPRPGPQDPAWIQQVAADLDRGTKRAILALYRSADPEELELAGCRLGELRCPALVVWGEGDPYIGLPEAERYALTLPQAHLRTVPGVGHWPLREEPSLVDEIVAFLSEEGAGHAAADHLM